MSSVSSAPLNIFNAEFLSSPAATAAAWISIIGAVILICKLIGALFQYRKSHNEILKKIWCPRIYTKRILYNHPLKKFTCPWLARENNHNRVFIYFHTCSLLFHACTYSNL